MRVSSFNVEGLEFILLDPVFTELITLHDICPLVETEDDTKLDMQSFYDVSQARSKEKKNGKYSGGIIILV